MHQLLATYLGYEVELDRTYCFQVGSCGKGMEHPFQMRRQHRYQQFQHLIQGCRALLQGTRHMQVEVLEYVDHSHPHSQMPLDRHQTLTNLCGIEPMHPLVFGR